MIIPGFRFFWNRISDEWLLSRRAAFCFGIASVIVIALTPILWGGIGSETNNWLMNLLWAVVGIVGALSLVFVWTGMWQYWLRLDSSSKSVRRMWYFALIVGFWYGAILYYLLAYLIQRKAAGGKSAA